MGKNVRFAPPKTNFWLRHCFKYIFFSLTDGKALYVEVELPFVFRFYEIYFRRINISTFDAFVTFVSETNVKTQIDVLRRPEIRPSLENVIPAESVLYGSPSPDTFVVRWNKSFELVLYNSGVILFKYGAVSSDDENESRLVGIGFELTSSSNRTFYRIDKSPGEEYNLFKFRYNLKLL